MNKSIVYTQFKCQTLLFVHRQNPIRCYHTRSEWAREQWQWKGTLHSPKLQRYWSITIRLFNVINRTLIRGGESYPFAKIQLVYSTAPTDRAILCFSLIMKVQCWHARLQRWGTWDQISSFFIFAPVFFSCHEINLKATWKLR